MAKQIKTQPPRVAPAESGKATPPFTPVSGSGKPFAIKYPMLILAVLAFVMYLPALSFSFTELDDSIFIKEFSAYNEDVSNIFKAFGRGLFSADKDPYYRPLFSGSIILNYMISKDEIGSYHFINVLLHALASCLLYRLFIKLKISDLAAFLLTCIFVVHPVLSQAVAWIPGRNDTLLAIFTLSFFINAIDFAETGVQRKLMLSSLFLTLAFFTKETAVFAAPAAFVLIVVALGRPLADKRNITLYGSWVACFAIWFIARAMATVHINTTLDTSQQLQDFIHRLPVVVQYLGKIFLPLNLSVFPIQQDTVYYFGFAAIAILGALIFLAKGSNKKMIIAGFAVFILFLLPALLVPTNLNEQVFEHRLYLPMAGILMVLSQSVIFKAGQEKLTLGIVGAICLVFAVVNFNHQKNFSDPYSFWHSAAETSPNSAYALMMLGAREDKERQEAAYAMKQSEERKGWIKDNSTNFQMSSALFRKAYALNPKEKYLNFYYGCMLQKKDSVLASEPFFLAEKQKSNYYECDFYLARVAITKGDTAGAISYMKSFVDKDVANPQANGNLLLMYMTSGRYKEAKEQAAHMQAVGIPVPQQFLQQLNSIK